MRKYLYSLFLILLFTDLAAQVPLSGFNLGSTTPDLGQVCKVAPNGNVCVGGRFTGTMDLDPGAGVVNITSAGNDDIFLACYSSSGAFLWGFGIGGARYDAAWSLTFDTASNVILCGYFQTNGIDFDPGAGVTTVPYAGGTGLTYYGDGFVAKYSKTGVFQWAKGLGGSTQYDHTDGVSTDPAGNVYVSGEFCGVMTIAGGPTINSAVDGNAYILKYTSNGTYVWGHNFGLPGAGGTDCIPRAIQVSKGNIYVTGVFQGTADFNPWGTPAMLTTVGFYDAFIAKYDTNGNYVFAKPVSGTGYIDEALDLSLDASDNMYITGYSNSSSMTFNPLSPGTSTVTNPGGGANYDIFIAKYTSAGLYQWGTVLGGTGDDMGWGVDVSGGNVFFTGDFKNTVDMDPSGVVSNLVSAGGLDLYVTKYDLSGNYICGFRVGSNTTDDIGYRLTHDVAGNIYATGQFGGSAVDFNPSPGVFPLTSTGATDAFLVKYSWAAGGTTLAGYMIGDTICNGSSAQLTVVFTSGGPGPYDITLSDGVTTFTVTGVMSGVPFALPATPATTTIYTITSIVPSGGASLCATPSLGTFTTATIFVSPALPHFTYAKTECNTYLFTAPPGAVTCNWDFGDGKSATTNPVSHTYSGSGPYKVVLTYTTIYGCTGSDFVMLTSGFTPLRYTRVCNDFTFTAPAGAAYIWNFGDGVTAGGSPVTHSYSGKGPYNVTLSYLTPDGCIVKDSVRVTITSLVVDLGPDLNFCSKQTVTLRSLNTYTSATYLWDNGSTTPSIDVNVSGMYTLVVSENGCKAIGTVSVRITKPPIVDLGNDIVICPGKTAELHSSPQPVNALYSWSNGGTGLFTTVSSAGIYKLKVTVNGCSDSDAINISVLEPPKVTLSPKDTLLCEGEKLIITPAGDVSPLAWSNNTSGPSITVSESGVYRVLTSNACGTATDSITVRFDLCNIWFPSAFTPNNDGQNDIIRVVGNLWPYADFELHMFNRFGQEVFRTTDIYEGWDGNLNGTPQDLGTYFYYFYYSLNGKKSMVKGDFQLIR